MISCSCLRSSAFSAGRRRGPPGVWGREGSGRRACALPTGGGSPRYARGQGGGGERARGGARPCMRGSQGRPAAGAHPAAPRCSATGAAASPPSWEPRARPVRAQGRVSGSRLRMAALLPAPIFLAARSPLRHASSPPAHLDRIIVRVVVEDGGVLCQRRSVHLGHLRGRGVEQRSSRRGLWAGCGVARGRLLVRALARARTFLSLCLRAACRAIWASTFGSSSSLSSPNNAGRGLGTAVGFLACAPGGARTVRPYLMPFCPIITPLPNLEPPPGGAAPDMAARALPPLQRAGGRATGVRLW